jgi:heme exporter protein A
MSGPDPILSVNGLALDRGGRTLFSGIGFDARPGGVLLLRGPNGAGKSSLLLTLAGLLHPAAGTIRYGDSDEPWLDRLHLVGHQPGVKSRLSLRENLQFWIKAFGGDGQPPDLALEAVGLGGLGALEAGYLSAGQTRRLALARLLVVHRPIWLLDEPTSALDASGDGMVGRLIATHAGAGGIVIAATHHDLPLGEVPSQTLLLGQPA